MKKYIKNSIILISVVSLVIAYILYQTSPEQFANGNCWNVLMECTKFKWVFALSIFAPIFLLSLITYKMNEKVFKSWLWFSAFFSGIYIYTIATSKPGRSDGFSPTLIQTVLFIWLIYLIISFIIIFTQYYRTRGK
jgi:hypothetical protein